MTSIKTIRLLFRRELTDQFRDRRTMMMIFVVPLLLYPLLGVSFFQVSQFVREKPSRLQVLYENDTVENQLPESPLLDFSFEKTTPADSKTTARQSVAEKRFDAVLAVSQTGDAAPNTAMVYFSSAHEKSLLARNRADQLLARWNKQLAEENLQKLGLDYSVVTPLRSESTDIAEKSQFQGASFWSKMFPIMLLLWALTGAFYPAVDLCAGEKERGTLETLLCSPARRTEIVVSKLLTVMCFSILSSVLNIICLGVSCYFIVQQLPGNAAITVPWNAVLFMVIPLFPAALIFSALSLALASFAKSTKEGQYYLLPLILVTMPLIFVSMASGSELTLGTALLPVTGIALILQQLLEGNTAAVFQFAPVVLGVTLLCCFVSVRLAVRQFNRESILLGDAQKFDLAQWCRSMFANRRDYPAYGAAILFGLTILALKYFSGFAFTEITGFSTILVSSLAVQIGVLLLPALCFVFLFTTAPRKALALEIASRQDGWRTLWNVILASLAAYCFLPAVLRFNALVQTLYPASDAVTVQLVELQRLTAGAPLAVALLVFAFLPAICEEIAFRGAMLGGLLPKRREGERTDYEGIFEAVVISAVFFGIIHGILQQSINAALLGCVLGLIAVRTGSLYPCIAYHFTHNAAAVFMMRGFEETETGSTALMPHLPPMFVLLPGIIAILCLRKHKRKENHK